MSSVRSALDELRSEDLRFSGEELEDGLIELERAANVLLAGRLRRLTEIERRRTYVRDGFLSASVWLGRRARLSLSEAKQQVRMAPSGGADASRTASTGRRRAQHVGDSSARRSLGREPQ